MSRTTLLGILAFSLWTPGLFAQITVTSVTPDEFSYFGGTPFVIQGSGFPAGGSVVVRIGARGAQVTEVFADAVHCISVPTPPTTSPLAVTVIVPGVGQAVLPFAVTVLGPLELTSIAPTTLPPSGGDITLTGIAFTDETEVWIGSEEIDGDFVTYIDPRTLRVSIDGIPAGVYDVEVRDGSPQVTSSLSDALTIQDALSASSFTPNEVSFLGKTPFVLNGQSFTPDTVITMAGTELFDTYSSATMLTGITPPSPTGKASEVSAFVFDPTTGEDELDPAYTYVWPFAIDSVTPTAHPADQSLFLSISGLAFTPDTRVGVADQIFEPEFLGARNLRCSLPPLEPGIYDVTVYDLAVDDTPYEAVLPDALLIYAPDPAVITGVEPRFVCRDGSTRVQVIGRDFLPESEVRIGGWPLTNALVSEDGTEIIGQAPVLPIGVPAGAHEVTVSDPRGDSTFGDTVTFLDECASLLPLEQFDTSLAEGTARFRWYNPEPYESIEVYDGLTGQLVDVLAGDADFYEYAAVGRTEVELEFVGVGATGQFSDAAEAVAAILICNYPPPIGGAVEAGTLDLAIYGGHAPASIVRCTDGGGDPTPDIVPTRRRAPSSGSGSGSSLGTFGSIIAAVDLGVLGLDGGAPRPTTLTTGFELEQEADRLEFSFYYEKVANAFGVSLRAKIVQVYPEQNLIDEFTLPDPFVGDGKKMHRITYYRATDDVGDSPGVPCEIAPGELLPIPAGEYRLEIYCVGGEPSQPYYVFADDPRDEEILIETVPCPPYPLVQVRDLTGSRTLPNVTKIDQQVAFELSDGRVAAVIAAHGTFLDETGQPFSIDPYCDQPTYYPTLGIGGSGGPPILGCADPQYVSTPQFEYCWTLRIEEPPVCKVDGPITLQKFPSWSCFKVELMIRDKACGTSRTYFQEVALLPNTLDLCTPGNPYYSFLPPTPDPSTIFAIGNLRNPTPGNGSFQGVRPLDMSLLVVPRCYCDGVPLSQCPGAFVYDDTPTTPPGAPPDLSDPSDQIQFRLAVRQYTSIFPLEWTDHDLNAEVRVNDLCPDVAEGPKYFRVYVDDLSEVPFSPYLDDQVFRRVYLQGRTNCYDTGSGCQPQSDWRDIASFKMTNHPSALDVGYWRGQYEEATATYEFVTQAAQQPEIMQIVPDSQGLDFGIVDAGIPPYEGQNVRQGFTARFETSGGVWRSGAGIGTTSGILLDNELQGSPHLVDGEDTQVFGLTGGLETVYEWCDQKEIFRQNFSQELFRSIIYAGTIGPIPVNIWGSVGLGLRFSINSLVQTRVAPFAPLSGGNYFEFQAYLLSSVALSIPCEVSADILGGIASLALRLVPETQFDVAPYIDVALGADPREDISYFIEATIEIALEVEACVQTLIFGEQCLPTITIPLVPETEIIDNTGHDYLPSPSSACMSASAGMTPSLAGGIVISSYEVANRPMSFVSPNGEVVVDGWASADGSGRFLKMSVTEGDNVTDFESGVPGISWYFLDPAGAFISNDKALIVGTSPPAMYTPEAPPMDLMDPDAVAIRSRNAAHTEVTLCLLEKVPPGFWTFTGVDGLSISDPSGTPGADRRADGRPSIAAIPGVEQAMVSWVRYTDEYLIQDGFVSTYQPCPSFFCLQALPNIRPQMEASSIAVRRVDAAGIVDGITTISDPGINIQPNITWAKDGSIAMCVWIHDPTHTDLLTSNRGRFLKYAIYDPMSDTWSAPQDVVLEPDDYPGILEPRVVLKDANTGLVAFTALDATARVEDSGFGGGSRSLFTARLVGGVFQEPVRIRGRCDEREYGYGQSIFLDIPEWQDPLSLLKIKHPEWVMCWQQFGQVGLPSGSGEVMVSVLPEGATEWTAPMGMLQEGTVVSNVTASLVGGGLHSIHYSGGPALVESGIVVGPPSLPGYQVRDHLLSADAVIVGCDLSQPFAGPGSPVQATVRVENQGLASTAYSGTFDSAVGLAAIYVAADGTETVVATAPIPVLEPGEQSVTTFDLEMPHDSVELLVRITPNPFDMDTTNDTFRCYLGTPMPEDFTCRTIEQVDQAQLASLSVELTWNNPVIYDSIWLYRDGSMIVALPGDADSFVDVEVAEGVYFYEVRGVIAASKSPRSELECFVQPPPPPGVAFLRGDANGDGTIDISDGVFTLNYLFVFGEDPPCLAAADANADGAVNVADAVYLLGFLFQFASPPPPPHPTCGESTESGDLSLGCLEPGC